MIPQCFRETAISIPYIAVARIVSLVIIAGLPAAAADNDVSITDTGGKAACTNVQTVSKSRTIVDCPAGGVYNFCFTREVTDLTGLLNGTLHYFSDPTYADQSQIGWDDNQSVYYGVLKWETAEGDLMTREVGIWDGTNKNYVGLGTVTGGTGRFETATGSLVSYGNGDSGSWSSGTVCLN